ncbi:MAG: hypothetical protein ABSF26_25060 [Thermoguttaceae bacterium]|jgi:hypothetical protein
MNQDNPDNLRRWADTWAKAGPRLERIRDRELRDMGYEERVRAIASLLQMAPLPQRPRITSGLVEMQRLFRKIRP